MAEAKRMNELFKEIEEKGPGNHDGCGCLVCASVQKIEQITGHFITCNCSKCHGVVVNSLMDVVHLVEVFSGYLKAIDPALLQMALDTAKDHREGVEKVLAELGGEDE